MAHHKVMEVERDVFVYATSVMLYERTRESKAEKVGTGEVEVRMGYEARNMRAKAVITERARVMIALQWSAWEWGRIRM